MQVGAMTGHGVWVFGIGIGTGNGNRTGTETGTGHILSNTHYITKLDGQTGNQATSNRYSLKTQLRDTRGYSSSAVLVALCLYGVGAVFPRVWRTLWMCVPTTEDWNWNSN